ncbi:Non-functional NADPH-dependent codeinone reductase 2-like [Asimina triloba]
MEKNPTAVLSSGEKIPLLASGTAGFPLPDEIVSSLIRAIQVGYRHFDTAAVYGSEPALGEAIAQALRLGIIESRSELFITSKLWCTDAHHDRILPALNKTLRNLGLEYIDLYLIHWPVSMKPGEHAFPFNKDDLLPMDFKAVWEAMEECQKIGLTKSIGTSNFSSKKLLKLLDHAKIPPAVNQVEMNPAWQQKRLREFCKEHGIHVMAWSPLGSNGAFWGSLAVMGSQILKQIADEKGKTIAQVCLRWLFEQGVTSAVKSFNQKRMEENRQILDWELTEEDLQQISRIPQSRGFPSEMFVSSSGPFKSIEELWDEEEA